MSAGLKGPIDTVRALERRISDLPRVLAQKVAAGCAEEITRLAKGTFAASENAYGDPWKPGEEGQTVTLKQSGELSRGVAYMAIGTKLRARLGPRYSKYQVGTRPILPTGKLPIAYQDALRAKTAEIVAAHVRGA